MDFEAYLAEKCSITLNAQQREAVYTTEGPVLLLAVPGSGKTTVVAARCAHMALCRGIPAQSILTLTFNRSARIDMEARFLSLFDGAGATDMRFSTIHSFCYTVLKEYGALVGRRMPRLMEDGKPKLLRAIYGRYNGGEYLPEDRLEQLTNAIGYAKNSMMTAEQIRENRWDIRNFCGIFTEYEQYKDDNGFMDFDDMPDKALAAFKCKPELLQRFRDRYRYVNVDEAQDTSRLQHEIIRLLAAPSNNLLLVGDEDQSIYAFRASSPETLLEFRQIYPEGKVLLMERNYRSTAAIVSTANRLIKRNASRHKKAMQPGNEAGPAVAQTDLPNGGCLPAHIVAALAECTETGSAAVLYRENASAVALMDALERAGIPFCVREHRLDFFSHWAVRDMLAFLKLAYDPADIAALRQIYWKLGAAISRGRFDEAAARMARGGCATALEALLAGTGLNPAAAIQLKTTQLELEALREVPAGQTAAFALARLGYRQHLTKTMGGGYQALSAMHLLEGLMSVAAGAGSYDGLLHRIGELTELAAQAGSGRGKGAVTLSTVHSAKGLEFDRVIVTDLVEGRFPAASAIAAHRAGNRAPLEEERRLFYVAITRARRHVELVTVKKVLDTSAEPSRFLQEALPMAPLRRALERHLARRPADGKTTEEDKRDIEIGMEVRHKSFGTGIVTAYDPEQGVVAVRFQKYGVKMLAEEFCRASPCSFTPKL